MYAIRSYYGNDHLFEIGEMDGVITPRIAKIAGILNAMGPVQVTDHLMDSRWGKLINNARITSYNVCYTKLLRMFHESPPVTIIRWFEDGGFF